MDFFLWLTSLTLAGSHNALLITICSEVTLQSSAPHTKIIIVMISTWPVQKALHSKIIHSQKSTLLDETSEMRDDLAIIIK